MTLHTITTDGEILSQPAESASVPSDWLTRRVTEQQDSPPPKNDENAPKNPEKHTEQEPQDSHQEQQNIHQESPEAEEINKTSDFSLLEVEMDGDVTGFIGCHVEVRNINGSIKFEGKLTAYEPLNGTVTIKTTEGAIRTAHVRETFVI